MWNGYVASAGRNMVASIKITAFPASKDVIFGQTAHLLPLHAVQPSELPVARAQHACRSAGAAVKEQRRTLMRRPPVQCGDFQILIDAGKAVDLEFRERRLASSGKPVRLGRFAASSGECGEMARTIDTVSVF
jgi:hypothetical protein